MNGFGLLYIVLYEYVTGCLDNNTTNGDDLQIVLLILQWQPSSDAMSCDAIRKKQTARGL